jgi:hypothetical protein
MVSRLVLQLERSDQGTFIRTAIVFNAENIGYLISGVGHSILSIKSVAYIAGRRRV